MNKKVYQISAKGLEPFTYEAYGLPESCTCDEQTGDILCDETTPRGIHSFNVKVTDGAGRETEGGPVDFEWTGANPFISFLGYSDLSIFARFNAVQLCPGNCSEEYEYTTYEKIPPDFINNRPFELFLDQSVSDPTNPDLGAVWNSSPPDDFYVEKSDFCELDPYGSPTEVNKQIVIEAKLKKRTAGYLFELYVNRNGLDGGQIFDTVYNMSDPSTQIYGQQFDNRNTVCNENGIAGPRVIGINGTVEIFPAQCRK